MATNSSSLPPLGNTPTFCALIMAGGGGTRFWPVSTEEKPKQFLDILGRGESMLQATARRLEQLTTPDHILAITSQRQTALAAEQLPQLPARNIYGEPQRRNTAPCIALAVAHCLTQPHGEETVMGVFPSDHLVENQPQFLLLMQKAIAYAAQHNCMVTLGITPTRPATEYGYIEAGQPDVSGFLPVRRFREKPNLETALEFLKQGDFFWNSGMFVWRVSTIAQALRKHLPGLLETMEGLPFHSDPTTFRVALEKAYAAIEPISIDYGVLEHADNIVVLPSSIGWSDVGTWQAVRDLLPKDPQGNVARGQVTFKECSNTIAWLPEGVEACLEGLEGVAVALAGGKLLVKKL